MYAMYAVNLRKNVILKKLLTNQHREVWVKPKIKIDSIYLNWVKFLVLAKSKSMFSLFSHIFDVHEKSPCSIGLNIIMRKNYF